jgi:regulator of sigma E protease
LPKEKVAFFMSYLIMLFLISLLVICHEFGHLLVARKCGVKVERFGLGLPFGPTLFKKKWLDIEWCLHALPLGGYVAFPDDNEDSTVPKDSIQRFENQPHGNQVAIALAGITVNAIMAILLMAVVLQVWGANKTEVFVNGFSPQVVQAGQTIEAKTHPYLSMQNNDNQRWLTLLPPVFGAIQLDALQWGTTPQQWHLQACTTAKNDFCQTVLTLNSSPAALTPLQLGDAIIAIDGNPITQHLGQTLPTMQGLLKPKANESVTLTVRPFETTTTKEVTVPVTASGKLGVALGATDIKDKGINFFSALPMTFVFMGNVIVQNFTGLWLLITGQVDPALLEGPVGIIKTGGQLIEQSGIEKGLILTAIISMILAVMNLLPIPPLDGSYLVYVGYEMLFKKPFNKEMKEKLAMSGFFIMLGLMAFVMINDLLKLFK